MHNLLNQSPLSIRNILSFLSSSDIIKLENIHPKFRQLSDLELYQCAIFDCMSILKPEEITLNKHLSNPYKNNDCLHTRSDFLNYINIIEDSSHNLLNDQNQQLFRLVWKFQLFEKDTSSPEYINPNENQDKNFLSKPHLINSIRVEKINDNKIEIYFRTVFTIIEKIQLVFRDHANLDKYLSNIDYIEYSIGGQTINRQDKFDLELFWRFHLNDIAPVGKDSNCLQLLAQNISYDQPYYYLLHSCHDLKITIKYDKKWAENHPELQIIGFNHCKNLFGMFERIIWQNESSPLYYCINNTHIKMPLNFLRAFSSLYLIVEDAHDFPENNEIIKSFDLTWNNITIASFKPETLCQVIPKHLSMPLFTTKKYYLISFNQINPFIYNLDSFKQNMNFSGLDNIELQIEFNHPFTGALGTKVNSLNVAVYTGVVFALRYY